MRPSGLLTASVTAIATLLLSGCGFFSTDPETQQPAPAPTEQSDDVDTVIEALQPLASEDSLPDSASLFEALEGAGYDPETLEATADESPLGNEVPAKVFGVRLEESCVIGEIRGADVSARIERQTESTGTCLLGEVDRPEGVDAPEGDPVEDGADDNGEGHMPDEDINDIPGESAGPSEAPEDSGGSDSETPGSEESEESGEGSLGGT